MLKFPRTAGSPLKEILVTDLSNRRVAEILVYCRHSRVRCESHEENTVTIDSRRAVEVAKAALLVAGDGPVAVLNAILARAAELILEDTEFGSDRE